MLSNYKFSLQDPDYKKKIAFSFESENQNLHKRLIDMLGVCNGDTVLDLGCGWGTSLPILLQAVGADGKIIGFDINENSLAISERLFQDAIASKTLELVLGQSNEPLPFKNDSFDKIFCHNVLENVSDKNSFLNECYRVLKPNGVLLLSHFDFDSALYNSSYKDLTRKLVHHFSDFTQSNWQTTSDGQIGRKLKGLIAHSKFKSFAMHTLMLNEERYKEDQYGFKYSEWAVEGAKKAAIVEQKKLDAWLHDLKELYQSNSYYFSISIMTVVATKS